MTGIPTSITKRNLPDIAIHPFHQKNQKPNMTKIVKDPADLVKPRVVGILFFAFLTAKPILPATNGAHLPATQLYTSHRYRLARFFLSMRETFCEKALTA
jgi:hypothetical protein